MILKDKSKNAKKKSNKIMILSLIFKNN